jgi:hypothetical protein
VALALLQAKKGDAAAVFNTVEEMRVHSLRVAVAASEREIARGMTSDDRAEEQRLDIALTTLIAQRTSERGLPKPDAARLAKLQVAIHDRPPRVRRLERGCSRGCRICAPGAGWLRRHRQKISPVSSTTTGMSCCSSSSTITMS